MSKAFQRLLRRQIDDYMNDKLILLLIGFKKNHNGEHCF